MESLGLTLIIFWHSDFSRAALSRYYGSCDQLILIYPEEKESMARMAGISGISWSPEEGKVSALNEAVRRAEGTHIFWMEDNESLPVIPNLKENIFHTARVMKLGSEHESHHWQIRLFPNIKAEAPFFTGFNIPNCRGPLHHPKMNQSETTLIIEREDALFPVEKMRKEVSVGGDLVIDDFWRGMLATDKKQFSIAVRYFKKVLQAPDLAFWNRLAAINCLANALMENHQLQEAKEIAQKSLQMSPCQHAPYLTIYQYYNLRGDREKAYQMLAKYRDMAANPSKANWDVFLPEDQVAFLMAENSYYLGLHGQAYRHYQEFYRYHKGQVSPSVLEKLLLYAVELQERAQAIQFFNAFFGDDFCEAVSDSRSVKIREVLSLFTDNGWYDFASDIYRQLVNQRPEDETLRHGWIRTLIKNDQVARAQALL